MNYPEWIPFAAAAFAAALTIINGVAAFSLKTLVTRIEKLEEGRDAMWRRIETMRVDSARDGATRGDIDKIHTHLQNQDKQLVAINTLLARLVPQAATPSTSHFFGNMS